MKETVKIIVAYIVVYAAIYCTLTWLQNLILRRQMKGAFGGAYERAWREQFNQNQSGMSVDEACKILGIKKKDLKNMSKDDLKRAYWKKAKEVHPDKPKGSDDLFKEAGDAWDYMKAAGYAA